MGMLKVLQDIASTRVMSCHTIETIILHSNREHPLCLHPFYQTLTLSHLPSVIQFSNPLRYWWCRWWDEGRDVLAVLVRRIVCLIN